jgi:hypothetical protein
MAKVLRGGCFQLLNPASLAPLSWGVALKESAYMYDGEFEGAVGFRSVRRSMEPTSGVKTFKD